MLIVIPAANEEKRIGRTLAALLKETPENYLILVVSNGNDGTVEIVRKSSKKTARVKLIEFRRKIGKGRAILEGLKKAHGMVAFYDADGSTPPEELIKMEKELKKGADIVICSRSLPQSRVSGRKFNRVAASRAFNLLVRFLFGLKYRDTQCGAKAFSEKARKWAAAQHWISTGFEWDIELLVRAKRAGLKIVEIPVNWQEKSNSTFRPTDMAKMWYGLMKLKKQLG